MAEKIENHLTEQLCEAIASLKNEKQIANFLGLCERQVRYYISRAKNNKINFSNISSVSYKKKSENE